MECLKKLEGHVLASHFKDLNEKSPDAHDVVWGTGVNDAKGLLAELKRQHFDGPLMVEYEHNWEKSMPEIAQCVEFFKNTTKEMGEKRPGKSHEKGEEKSKGGEPK
jgi:sugar phosphate isomerase/epimerase